MSKYHVVLFRMGGSFALFGLILGVLCMIETFGLIVPLVTLTIFTLIFISSLIWTISARVRSLRPTAD